MTSYVVMTDKMLSGWGGAEGKVSRFAIECDTQDQLDAALRYAHSAPEMENVQVVVNEPRTNRQAHVSLKHFNDVGLARAQLENDDE